MSLLTLHDLLTSPKSGLEGTTVVSITLKDYGVDFHLLPGVRLEVIEYWELFNSGGERLDNALTTENRKNFFLFKVIGKKVIGTGKFPDKFHIKFEEGWTFVIQFEPAAQVDKRTEERRKYLKDLKLEEIE